MMLDPLILTTLQNELAQEPIPCLFLALSGAHTYGFPSADSDYDVRGCHILSLENALSLNKGPETKESTKSIPWQENSSLLLDLVTYDIETFLRLLLKKNGNMLENVFSSMVLFALPEFEELKALAQGCMTRYHAYHYLGMAKTQWKLFEKNKEVKKLLYAFRALLTGCYLLENAEIETNLQTLATTYHFPFLHDLIQLKQTGQEKELLMAEGPLYLENYTHLTERLEQMIEVSVLPPQATTASELSQFLIQLRLEYRES